MAKSVDEIKQYHEKRQELFEKANKSAKSLQLVDLTKNGSRTYSTFNKETLRTYMRNPFANADKIRALSRYLYRLSFPYRRLIHYNAQMIDLTAMSVIPKIDFLDNPTFETIKDDYFKTLVKVRQMHLETEILKMLIVAWREDVCYGYIYDDDDLFYIHQLDGDYCKISSVEGGKLNFAYDFSYFRSHETDLEYWDSEFNSKYTSYTNDNSLRWQELDPERTICFKINIDDLTLPLPPFLALFEQLIDLVDLQALQNVKDELSIYKMLVARLETLNGATIPDDFSVDPDTALLYYKIFESALPESVSAAISPLKIDPIEFKGNTTEDVDMISNSMNNLFLNAGGSQMLNNPKVSGTTAFNALIKADSANAIKALLPQIQIWMNYYLTVRLGDNHSLVKYLEVSYLTKEDKKKELLESAQYGVPVKLAVASLDGFYPLDTLALQIIENEGLQLHNEWIPLQSSYTQSGTTEGTDPITGGRPQSDELTPNGEITRERS